MRITSNYARLNSVMYCPACGIQNEAEHGYCRQCGQALFAVRIALEGNADQSLKNLKSSDKWISAGTATTLVFTLIALAISIAGIASNNLELTNIALINLMLGLGIGIPLIFVGQVSLKRAKHLLSKSRVDLELPSHRKRPGGVLTAGLEQDSNSSIQDSVTEDTTRKLQGAERKDARVRTT